MPRMRKRQETTTIADIQAAIVKAHSALDAVASELERFAAQYARLFDVRGPEPVKVRKVAIVRAVKPQPLTKWQAPIVGVMQTQGVPLTSTQIREYVCDTRGIKNDQTARHMVRSTLYLMKRRGLVSHDKATGLYNLTDKNPT